MSTWRSPKYVLKSILSMASEPEYSEAEQVRDKAKIAAQVRKMPKVSLAAIKARLVQM